MATIVTTITSTIDLETLEQTHHASIDAPDAEAQLDPVVLYAVAKSGCVATVNAIHEQVPALHDSPEAES